ncbi:MAG: hypothetical protein K2X66_02505, partial [Cyanobacteria bacterium]|nr:hypothetical protein [Cyanobacteriota bacterium]
MVKAGLLGFYPVNTLSLASLYTEQAEMVMGAKDQSESLHLKSHPTITLVEGGGDTKSSKKAKEPFDTNGKVFNGFSDAFY